MLKRAASREMERLFGADWRRRWRPLHAARVDALILLRRLRDPFELPASLKIELDALASQHGIRILEDDGPRNIERGYVGQSNAGSYKPSVLIRITPIERVQAARSDILADYVTQLRERNAA